MCVFCCKQKTAYEMRISDWSSDVCSSGLREGRAVELAEQADAGVAVVRILGAVDRADTIVARAEPEIGGLCRLAALQHLARQLEDIVHRVADEAQPEIGSEACRGRVCPYV